MIVAIFKHTTDGETLVHSRWGSIIVWTFV